MKQGGGKDCTCQALAEWSCICKADWTPQEVYDLRKKVRKLKKTIAQIKELILTEIK